MGIGEGDGYHARSSFANGGGVHILGSRSSESSKTKDDKEVERHKYKFALIAPHIGKIPVDVIEVMLDLDLIKGYSGTSPYDTLIKSGEVKEIIEKNIGTKFSSREK